MTVCVDVWVPICSTAIYLVPWHFKESIRLELRVASRVEADELKANEKMSTACDDGGSPLWVLLSNVVRKYRSVSNSVLAKVF